MTYKFATRTNFLCIIFKKRINKSNFFSPNVPIKSSWTEFTLDFNCWFDQVSGCDHVVCGQGKILTTL